MATQRAALGGVVRRWVPDSIIRRLLKNLTYLFSGNLAASVLSLAALALTARALGPAQFGILVLIEAYIRLIDRLVRIEPWQALIKYGAEALEQGR
ncbi:MAG: lipopolysaccharide biosynthesis protein, partial [Geminicoccales bacterium]